jgi:hypothetical protein
LEDWEDKGRKEKRRKKLKDKMKKWGEILK